MIPNSTVLMKIIVARASCHIGQANTHPDEFSRWMFCFKRHCLRISGRFEILRLRFCSKSQISKTVI